MTFSREVKEELERNVNNSRHCQLAEMAAYVVNIGNIDGAGDRRYLTFHTENEGVIKKVFTLLKKIYNIDTVVKEHDNGRGRMFEICIDNPEAAGSVLMSVKNPEDRRVSSLVIKNACCKRAYLMGTFLCIGSMSSPDKSYHLEFVSSYEGQMEQIKELIADFDIEARVTRRKNSYVLYVKEGDRIVDLLNIMGAHVSLMNMENVIILKDMRNSLNRRVNCETANIIKSVNAANRQVEDINFLKKHHILETLPDSLQEMAAVRISNPDAPLKDLCNLLDPPVGKSGVNHRLRRLSEIADSYRMCDSKSNGGE